MKSIDGFFNEKIIVDNFQFNKKNFSKINTIIGEGNSISHLPYYKNTKSIKLNDEKKFIIDKKKNIISVNGNAKISEVHNFLLKNKFFCHYFPSYPLVTVGACIANGTHGIIPKNGIFTDFVKEIEIYNPNFGIKILSNSKNKKLFELTKCGFGLTGVILNAKLKIFELKSTTILVKYNNYNSLKKCYEFLKRSKTLYNQNTFTINYNKRNIFNGRLFLGIIKNNDFNYKKLKDNKILGFRLGLFKIHFLKILIFELGFFIEKFLNFFNKKKHINDILFTSNKKTLYFNFMPKKFIEYQNLIPDSKVNNYLKKFEDLVIKHKPTITLIHLKKFQKNGKNFEFKMNGLAIAMHIIIDKNFSIFYRDLKKLDLRNKCLINLYKNSLVDIDLLRKFHPKYLKYFISNIKKINKKVKLTNNIFKNNL